MIDAQEFFVVQTQPRGFVNLWEDEPSGQRHETVDAAYVMADDLREHSGLEVRVIRRWI